MNSSVSLYKLLIGGSVPEGRPIKFFRHIVAPVVIGMIGFPWIIIFVSEWISAMIPPTSNGLLTRTMYVYRYIYEQYLIIGVLLFFPVAILVRYLASKGLYGLFAAVLIWLLIKWLTGMLYFYSLSNVHFPLRSQGEYLIDSVFDDVFYAIWYCIAFIYAFGIWIPFYLIRTDVYKRDDYSC